MPGKIIIEIESGGVLQPQGAHAITQELIRNTASKELHDRGESLTFPSWRRAGRGWEIEVSSPDDRVLLSLLQGAQGSDELRVGGHRASITRCSAADKIRWNEVREGLRPIPELALEFTTPTCFRQGPSNLPLPVPELIARSALRRCPEDLQQTFSEAAGQLQLSHADIATTNAQLGKGKALVGFTGLVVLNTGSEEGHRLLHLLRRILPYVHVGAKGAYGMGHSNVQARA